MFFLLFEPEEASVERDEELLEMQHLARDRMAVESLRFATSLNRAQEALRGSPALSDTMPPRSSRLPAE